MIFNVFLFCRILPKVVLPHKRLTPEDEKKQNNSGSEWISEKTLNAKHPLVRLHNEILDYGKFVEPNEAQKKERHEAIKRVANVAKNRWPSCEILMFGSLATGLSLYNSDVDLVF